MIASDERHIMTVLDSIVSHSNLSFLSIIFTDMEFDDVASLSLVFSSCETNNWEEGLDYLSNCDIFVSTSVKEGWGKHNDLIVKDVMLRRPELFI